ncbi:hypothetical protein DLJ49_17265 [Rhodovulum sp. 12E13]|uniref:hypothetical protein n=1 Tax=Rhodovulum sp. 12E13 TaxID=2203891 RepID=UPI000E19F54A|nr:hypothetical protein [Rhodovulum sp. 12E13]RDC70936.1 hypothetical protein DLJ49_17265 [Rhodovulum sp. 12E13]
MSYRKSIRRDDLEERFESLLHSMEPSPRLYELAKAMFKEAWQMKLAQAEDMAARAKIELRKLDKKIEELLDRIVDASNQSVVSAYERRVSALEREKLLLRERLDKGATPKTTWEESFELATRFLSSPWKVWKNADLALRKTVLRLAFLEPLPHCRNQGLRTPKMAYPFKALGDFSTMKCEMARWGGFEPPTP